MDLQQRIKQIAETSAFICPVCGAALYITDYSDQKLTFHCSSEKAKFWTFGRRSEELTEAKVHWDRSAKELPISKDMEG